jgi:succinate dehydrogenase / fumarate reductase cytochrome b subunit
MPDARPNEEIRMAHAERPLSPHLGIYRWQLTMVLSIVHRATGVALAVGTIVVIALLLALAAGPEAYAQVRGLCGSWPGLLLLLGWTWALCFHLFNGIRHLAWDAGWGFEIPHAYLTGWTVVALSIVATGLIWACVFAQRGTP